MHLSIQVSRATASRGSSISRLRRRRRSILHSWQALLTLLFLLLASATVFAGSATWDPHDSLCPTCWRPEIPGNWTPATVPNGPDDIATFDVSDVTGVGIDETNIEVNGIVFNAGASPFTIAVSSFSSFDVALTISGVGITNHSGITQNFTVSQGPCCAEQDSVLLFTNSASAGELTVFTVFSSLFGRGTISFEGDSTADAARIRVFEDGNLDISAHNAPGLTIDSIEGDGTVTLGGNNLTVGSNEHDTTFSGVIQDGGAGGSLTKVGRRSLVLANGNAYSGGTTIRGGHLLVSNRRGSATGSGAVQVAAGRLGGTGIIAGRVTVGTGIGAGSLAELSPGDNGVTPGETLTFLSSLTVHSHGVLLFDVNSDEVIADLVIADGVTIGARAKLLITDLGPGILKNAELYDEGDGIWSVTGSLGIARSNHTATLLPNGKVLVAGGDSTTGLGSTLSSAELYDPATATWTETGSLTTARSWHTATLLPDGKVLVAGGNLGFGPTASAELYDPANESWTPTGNMTSARYFHTATLLPSGKVLVVGSPSVATAELYDPASGSWTLTGPPITSRWSHTATLLTNGQVLVAGGSTGIGIPTALAELYDPATGAWTATGKMHDARQVHAAALLPDGKVLVAAGQGRTIFDLKSAELYDPASGTWTTTGSLATPRSYYTATLLPNGKVMAAGGNNGIHFMEASVELYDPASGAWAETGSLDPGRYSHTANLLPDGKVLVAGGVGFGLPVGTVFTVISNTSATPINGTFSNLPDGSTITVGGKSCQVSYSGGDGNDLTLTVVP